MKKLKYLKIGEEGEKAAVGIMVREIPEILFMCEDGKSHQESFKILSDILSDIFSETFD